MLQYILKRLLLMLPTLFGVLLVSFIVIQFVPGGPVEQMVYQLKGRGAAESAGNTSAGTSGGAYQAARGLSEEQLSQIKTQYGFDKPAPERFWLMLKSYASFDLGESWFRHASVTQLIREKLPVSMSLGISSLLLTYLIAVPLGVAKAVRQGSRFDAATTLLLMIGYAIPSFVLGVVLLVLFGGGSFWQVFPLRGLMSDDWEMLSILGKAMDLLWHLALPVTAMVAGGFASLTMLTKNSFLEEIHKQYVTTARAKGASEKRIFWRHILRNAALPLVVGLPEAIIAAFFTGSLLIETLFSLDGLGLLAYESVIRRDYPVVLGTLYFFTLLGLIGKLLSDLGYVLLDPRVQFGAVGEKS
ncbi:ABC transporter permease subunit [Chitinibacter bivalviorum]|uniref:ABC transporter permease subunit n=1 Tax=Chitinibacter bivalviorum TaxID=2739434 RepID=A0A7H9BEY1_9NEIS|nr:ABC transporter permease subunit [Chitinibacter bivalviorum]QLG87115.1 ABC transporter permease subunit [Chitinibacter bivalviorum]